MAAPSFVGAGSLVIVQTGSGAVTKTATVGNILILQVLSDGNGALPAISSVTNIANIAGTGSSMDQITSVGQSVNVGASGADGKQALWIGRCTSASTSVTVTVNADGNDCYCILWEFTDVSTSTTIADVVENGASQDAYGFANDTTILDVAVTTNGADRLALNFIAVMDDNQASFDTEAFTGQTGGTWVCGGGFGSSTGTDGAVGLQYATMASAGTIDGGSLTMATDPWGVCGFALTPAAVTYQPRYGFVNHQEPGIF